ncbi:MAG: TonB-dependent receptor [Bacteroidetes bacterium]|nr:TonB-dependent receptor [Bacteroidota bacterium]
MSVSLLTRRLVGRLFVCLCISGAAGHIAIAANGNISGRITDAGSQGPLVGATVLLKNTLRGTITDSQGFYSLDEIQPGSYTIQVTHVGYGTVLRLIRVGVSETVTVDFALIEKEVEFPDEVIAYSPVVDPGRTTPKTTLTKGDISSLPLRSQESALTVSPSLYKGFVRGGRQYETKTLIDGVDVTDQFHAAASDQVSVTPYMVYNAIMRQSQANRSSLVSLNALSVDETNVLAGTTSSEYASATGGVIEYNLQAPAPEWTAKVNVSLSQFGLAHAGPRIYNDDSIYTRERAGLLNKNTAADSTKAKLYTYTPGKYSYGERPTFDAEFSFGREFDEGGIFLTTRFFNSYGRLPNEFTRRINSTVRMNVRPADEMNLTGLLIVEDRGRMLGWKNRDYADDFRYFLEGVPKWDGVNVVGSVKFSQVLTSNLLYEVQASFVRDLMRRGFSDDNNDGIIALDEDGDFLTFGDTAQVNRYMAANDGTQFEKFFTPKPRNEIGSETTLGGNIPWKLARPGIFYERFVNSVFTLKGDVSSRLSTHHQLKAGAQFRFHNLARTLRAAYIGGVFPQYKNYVEEIWNIKPKEYGLYAEDRIELEGLILNLGFRLDVLDLSAGDYADYFAPFRDDTTLVNGSVTDLRRLPVRTDNASSKILFSPRLGVSHPISDRAALYFSFSRQQQSQPFSRLYSNYNDFGNPSLPVITRTNQDPIRSTNYDLGIQWMFADNYGIDINAYYKDIENYGTIMFSVTPRSPWRGYNISTNFGYADSRGVEFTVRSHPTAVLDWLTLGGRVSYSYSYIKQAVYAGGNVTTFSSASDSARYNGQLPFDDIRSFNTIERNVLGGSSTLTGGYDRTHRIAFNLLFRFPLGISLSGVGMFQSGFYYPLTLGDPRARELGVAPWNRRIDLRVEKVFTVERIARIALYVDIMNAFNWTNIAAYNSSTLGQEAWEKYGDPTGGSKINRAVTQDGSMVYDNPREFYFGMNITF